jgi:ubiquinone biosynthesis protein
MALEHGNLSGNVCLFADQRDAGFVAGLLCRAIMAFVGATLGIMSVVLLSIRGGPMLLPASAQGSGTSMFRALGYLGLFFSFVLVRRVIIATAREGIG